jgi:hypothetical protein
MARDFAADDMQFYRCMIKQENVVEWSFLAGPYRTPGMAQSQGTRAVNDAAFWDGPVKVFKVQRLEAVMHYEFDVDSHEGYDTPHLEWVDYVQ